MKKTESIIFIAVTIIMISIPGIFTNIKPDQQSKMDNRMLQEFPEMGSDEFQEEVEQYLSDRIGLRENMITFYQNLCSNIFHKLVHPLFIDGQDGHVMVDYDLISFQHLDVDPAYVENFSEYLESLQNFCESMGSEFVFFLCTNKETIYPEYFPKGYHIKEQPNRSDQILEALTEKEVSFIYPKEIFFELKNKEPLYNKKYDVAHWNDTGSFYGNREIISYIHKSFPNVDELEKDEFKITEDIQPYLPNSYFKINEKVPEYTLKEEQSVEKSEVFSEMVLTAPKIYYKYYKNQENQALPRILIFGDSYFEHTARFYLNRSSELMLLHSDNMVDAEYYISLFQPDIVITEFVERVLQIPHAIDNDRIAKRFPSSVHEEKIHEGIQITSYHTESEEFISVYGIYNDLKDSEEEMVLKAVVNQKEYYANRNGNTFCFTFRREDFVRDHQIDFYKCF